MGVPSVLDPDFDVLIVGGGFSGAMLAVHLLRTTQLSVVILDRNGWPGRGLAYGTPYRFHLLNVPAEKMSALPDQPDHFLRWVRINHDASIQPRSFVARSVYGEYVGSLLEVTSLLCGVNRFLWLQDEVLSLRHRAGLNAVQRKHGPELLARAVVVATGNFPPADPRIPGLRKATAKYFPFAWSSTALEQLPAEARVLLIGSGLTAIDMIMALKSKGFRGTIHVISRKGLLPHRHRKTEPWPLFWNDRSPRTTRGLIRLIREQVRCAAETGIDWRSVVDCLRPVTQQIWQSLPQQEQKRFLRHARSLWEAHRHRVAPEIADLLADMMNEGQVVICRGRIYRYLEEDGQVRIVYREPEGAAKSLRVDRVINCTGSETDCRRIDDSLITSLFVQGLARPDGLFLGLDVDDHGALLDYQGNASQTLFAIGPTRKGRNWETTAVPEIRQQAAALAAHLARVVESGCDRATSFFDTAV